MCSSDLIGLGGNPRYAQIDPERAAELAVCEAVRNVVAVGARPAALTDCLNFGNPEDPIQMGQFVAGVDGLARAARELKLAFVTGNVSFYNQASSGASIPPSPIVSCIGIIDDVAKSVTMNLKRAGSKLFLVEERQTALGGSVISESSAGSPQVGLLPEIRYAVLRSQIAGMLEAFELGLILAAHDISDGGLLPALSEMLFATRSQDLGVQLSTVGDAAFLFGEPCGLRRLDNEAARLDRKSVV